MIEDLVMLIEDDAFRKNEQNQEYEEEYVFSEEFLLDILECITKSGRICRIEKMGIAKPDWPRIRVFSYSVTVYKKNMCAVECRFDGDVESETQLGGLIYSLRDFCEQNGIEVPKS